MNAVRAWAGRTTELRRELAAIAEPRPWWWLLAGAVAVAETRAPPETYLACDVEPDGDTFMAYPARAPRDLVGDAIARAHAARTALRELDGSLPDQPLAVTIDRERPDRVRPSALDVAAFAIGAHRVVAALDDPSLPAQLAAVMAGGVPRAWDGATPFVCVAIGDEPIETARHGHRRAWTDRGGPWLGLGRASELAIVSTCHLAVDGYGHALVAARIAELTRHAVASHDPAAIAPGLADVDGAVPLAVTWRELPRPTPHVVPLAYELGCLLHRRFAPGARFSPTMQIPVARGRRDDPMRLRRRIVSATISVRFDDAAPQSFEEFEAHARGVFDREAAAAGLVSRLLAAARAAPVPVGWKRKSISAKRPRWLEAFADVIGGRALLSRIVASTRVPLVCAVSSPSKLASDRDPIGGCVITILETDERASITLSGSGFAGTTAKASAFLDELLAGASRSNRSSQLGTG